jgi:hypothetical protein
MLKRHADPPRAAKAPRSRRALSVAVGDYLRSEHDLYRVEQLWDGHALVEDCRSGELIDVGVPDLAELESVTPAA